MKIKYINIKDGAFFVADVHYKKGDRAFLNLLQKINKNPPSQLFLLGDIFHLLLPFSYLIAYNKEAIDFINLISKKCEVYYAYGNHDFLIDPLFQGVSCADVFIDKNKSVYITHGDLNEKNLLYRIYSICIRNKIMLNLLNFFSFNFVNNWLFKKILEKKIDCNRIKNFRKKIFSKIENINYNMIIEGHYHQNKCFENNKKYCNLGAFTCEKCYYAYINSKLKEIKNG